MAAHAVISAAAVTRERRRVTGQEIVPLHKRIRQEAAGLTRGQAGQRLAAAERIALQRGAPGEGAGICDEWYGISFVMEPGLVPGSGTAVYGPVQDGRPL